MVLVEASTEAVAHLADQVRFLVREVGGVQQQLQRSEDRHIARTQDMEEKISKRLLGLDLQMSELRHGIDCIQKNLGINPQHNHTCQPA